jgi:MarR family transcriptional regulator, transcriptional regulator for hemolysin
MQDNPDVNFGFLVSDVARLLREKFNATAQKLGLTLAQARVLAHLSRNEGISQVALSAILEVQPITLLRQIDRLEKAGLVERRVHPNDRRMQQLYLTPQSEPLLQQMFNVGTDLQGHAMVGLSESQRTVVVELLARIRANLAGPVRGAEAEAAAASAREVNDV